MGEHWVQDEHLRGLMRWIASQATLPGGGGLPEDPEGEATQDMAKAFAEAAAVADGLAEAADSIPAAVARRSMSAEDRAGFAAEAALLRERSVELGRAAREHKVERMQRALDGVNAACVSCHSKYRDLSGQLEPTRLSRMPTAPDRPSQLARHR